jgi:hypothetical protein
VSHQCVVMTAKRRRHDDSVLGLTFLRFPSRSWRLRGLTSVAHVRAPTALAMSSHGLSQPPAEFPLEVFAATEDTLNVEVRTGGLGKILRVRMPTIYGVLRISLMHLRCEKY